MMVGLRRAVGQGFWAAVLAAGLSGCGGGGGGGGEPAPAGTAQPLALSSANASDALRLSFGLGAAALALGEQSVGWIADWSAGTASAAGTVELACNGGGRRLLTLVDRDGNRRPSPGDQLDVVLENCWVKPLQDAFAGRLQIDLLAPTGTQTRLLRIATTNLRLADTTEPVVTLAGTLQAEEVDETLQRSLRVTTTALRFTATDGTRQLVETASAVDVRRTVRRDTVRTATTMALRYRSELLGGTLEVDTPVPLASTVDHAPDAGSLRATGAGGAAAVMALRDPEVPVTLDGAAAGGIPLGDLEAGLLWSSTGIAPQDDTRRDYPLRTGFEVIAGPGAAALRGNTIRLQWQFSAAIDPASIPSALLRRTAVEQGLVWGPAELPLTVRVDGALLTLSATGPLPPGSAYEAALVQPVAPRDGGTAVVPTPNAWAVPTDIAAVLTTGGGAPALLWGPQATLQLDGGGSSAAGGIVRTRWRQVSGPLLAIEDLGGGLARVRPDGTGVGTAVVEVEVADAGGMVDRERLSVVSVGDLTGARLHHARFDGGAPQVTTSATDASGYARVVDSVRTLDVLTGFTRLLTTPPDGSTWAAGLGFDLGATAPAGVAFVWSNDGLVCGNVTGGRLEVRELVRDTAGTLSGLAVDVDVQCGDGRRLVGAVRVGSDLTLP